MHAPRRALTVGHRVDDEARTERNVAGGKHARRGRHQRFAIHRERAARRDLEAIFGAHPIERAGLSDRNDDAIAFPNLFRVWNELRIKSPALVECARDAERFETGRATIRAEDALGRDVVENRNAFFLGFCHLVRIGEHFVPRFDDEALHLFRRAETPRRASHIERDVEIAAGLRGMTKSRRGARDIHRDVAAADHEHAPPEIQIVTAEIDVDEKIHRAQNAVILLALDVESSAFVRANRDQDRVEIAAQIGEREIAIQCLVEFEGGTEREDRLDFKLDQFTG